MVAVLLGLLAATCFVAPSLLALRGVGLRGPTRSYAIAVAAGILLTLAFGELFPEGLELAGRGAVVGFVGGFALLFLIEAFTHAHTHHAAGEDVHRHSLAPFIVGLAIHNAADGFALGVSVLLSPAATVAIGFGVLVHQLPVALSVAAVFAATGVSRRRLVRTSALLALAIPVAAGLTVAMLLPGDADRGGEDRRDRRHPDLHGGDAPAAGGAGRAPQRRDRPRLRAHRAGHGLVIFAIPGG
jgi:ZIP family zinc transporter